MKRQQLAQERLTLLRMETDSQLLRLKELEQRREQLEHRQQEMAESREYRTRQQLPQPEQPQELLVLSPLPVQTVPIYQTQPFTLGTGEMFSMDSKPSRPPS